MVLSLFRRVIISTGLCLFLLAPIGAHAAAPVIDAMISWRASTLVPSWYTGKVLPNFDSPITAALFMTSDGRLVNLQQYSVTWKLGGETIRSGRGLESITIDPTSFIGSKVRIQASITDTDGNLVSSPATTIERSSPRVVIDAPASSKRVSLKPVTLRALPFFFNPANLTELATSWLVDGVLVGNTSSLTVAATEDALPTVRVEARIENTGESLESAKQAVTLLPTL